jgi:hypothetical protein
MPPATFPPGPLGSEARLRDPAHRDQDGLVWRRDRFAERVRRQWNPLQLPGIATPRDPADLEALAQSLQARVGGDEGHIRARLAEFAALDEGGASPADDALLRPGAPAG